MKTKFLFLVLLSLVSGMLVVGCGESTQTETKPAPTNTPAK